MTNVCCPCSLGVVDDLRIQIIRKLPHKADGHGLDLRGLQRWKRPKNLVRAKNNQCVSQIDGKKKRLPRAAQELITDQNQLRNDTEQIQVRAICEAEVPKL